MSATKHEKRGQFGCIFQICMGGDKKERQNTVITAVFLVLAMAEIEKIQDTKNAVKFDRVFCVLVGVR